MKRVWVKYIDHGGSFSDSDEVVLSYALGGLNGATGAAGSSASLGGTMVGHIIPDTNAAYDLGNADYKIRHLFLSSNSLTIGDTPFSKGNIERSLEITPDAPPSSPTDAGKKGDVRVDDTHAYICTDTNTWKRIPLETAW
jgi:hypothetical protein